MKFPTLKGEKTTVFAVDALHGGCNLRDGNRAADGQLAAVNNLWWYNGALRTRPVFAAEKWGEGCSLVNKEITWKFCPEDTIKGTKSGRRFLRRAYDRDKFVVDITIGVLTYDGHFLCESSLTSQPGTTTGMVMEYPYSADENVLLFLSDGRIFAQNSQGTLRDIRQEAYVPCVLIDGQGTMKKGEKPPTEGKAYEPRNLLSDMFTAKYTATATGGIFQLPYTGIAMHAEVTISVRFPDVGLVEYVIPKYEARCPEKKNGFWPMINYENGTVTFYNEDGFVSPLPEGEANNITITAKKQWGIDEKALIPSMSFGTWFGGSRAGCDSYQFFGGSPYAKNRVYWSEQGQPLYFPETNYIAVGDINQSVTALGKQNGSLVIFKEREIYSLSGTQKLLSQDKVDGQLAQDAAAGVDYFLMTQVSAHVGCKAPRSVVPCGNRLCWADGFGSVYTLIDDTAGLKVRELSALIAPQLKTHTEEVWQEANGALYEGHYLLHVDHTIYVLRVDEKAFHQYANAYSESKAQQSLAWYVWTLPDVYTVRFLCGSGRAVSGVADWSYRDEEEDLEFTYLIPLCARDGNAENSDEPLEKEEDIPVSFTTKEYDFGMPFERKRWLRVYMGVKTCDDTKLHFSYLQDGVKRLEAREVTGNTTGELVLTPHVARVRRGGFILQGVGKIAVDSLTFTYR